MEKTTSKKRTEENIKEKSKLKRDMTKSSIKIKIRQ